jgi:UDP-N-acetylglucosamine enolpyruvyl transferase
LTYLAFANNFDYEINIYQVAIEPHVRNLIAFLNSIGADIHLNVDHSIVMKPSKIVADHKEFTIIADYIEAGTYFAI